MRFCDNNIKEGDVKIRIVHGNLLRLAIRLTRRTLEKVGDEIEATDEDFIPSSDYPVSVELSKGKEKLTFNATMREGSLACIEDKGTIPEGTYSVAVRCKDEHGNPYRFKQRTVVRVYDVTADAGITTPVEYEVGTWYLDAAIFLALSGEDGVGIDDIITEESVENGGYNTVTFVLSDGSTRWFRVRNGVFNPNNYYTKTQVDNRIRDAVSGMNLTGYYTKQEVNERLMSKLDIGAGMVKNDYIGRDDKLKGEHATQVVLFYMGEPYDEGITKKITDGQPIYENGYISYRSGNIIVSLGTPQQHIIYCNAKTNKLWRWNGTEFVHVGGSGSGVVVDTALDVSSNNPIANFAVTEKFNEVDERIQYDSTTETLTLK